MIALMFSLATLSSPVSNVPGTNGRTLSRTSPLFPAPLEKWYPDGPAMDIEQIPIYAGCATELNALGQPVPQIDLTDCPLTASLVNPASPTSFVNNPNLLVTSQIVTHGYSELEFMLDNNYWGIPMQFGNNPNGVHLRQGIAHLINKTIFNNTQVDIHTLAQPVDNPIPYGSKLSPDTFISPNSCNWDLNFTETGGVCTRAGGPLGGVAYDCAAPGITSNCAAGTISGTTNYPWQPQIGSADFC